METKYQFNGERYEKLLSYTKFKDYKIWEENADRYFPDEKSMIGWIEQPSIVPFLVGFRENMKKLFTDSVIERMIRKTKQPNRTCFETFRRINVYARK